MVPNTRLVPAAFAVVASLAGGPRLQAQSPDADDVKRVIQAETDTYYQRDAEGWKRTWIQDSSAIRTFITSGSYSVALGWDRFGPSTVESIQRSAPQAVRVGRTNYVVRIEGPLAWAEYDERTDMPGDSVPLVARQQRTLVKRNGEWRILSAGSFVGSTYGASPRAVESRLDAVGSDLSAAKNHHDAIQVLELNTRLFPRSASAFAALGAAYAATGDTRLAIQEYEKSLAIDPRNEARRAALAKLRERKSP
jgi:tetratricopeptide (TPR) repeat protein